MSIQKYIKENSVLIGSKVYIAPDIPPKKLDAAITSYGEDVDLHHVVALKDTSLFLTGKEGCLFLGDSVHMKTTFEPKLILFYEEIENVKHSMIEVLTKKGKAKKVEQLEVHYRNGEKKDISRFLLSSEYKDFAKFMNGIIEKGGEGSIFENTSQITPLSELNEEIKVKYIKVVANFAYSNDQVIDVKEYTEIISLIVRVEITSDARLALRAYMGDVAHIESTKQLLEEIHQEVDEDNFTILKQSLFKDVLYIFSQSNLLESWKEHAFLLDLSERLELGDDQIKVIIMAIQHDRDILALRKNDSQIEKSLKDIAAKAAGVGVPLAAIYFTGSVVGLSAAGITSGLAAMGFGGILGFSSMFTGIGALVLLGLGTYQGLKVVSGIGDVENNKQREFMLQAIIRNTQKSLIYLIEDINSITNQLMDEMYKGNQNSAKIEQLSNILKMLSEGAKLNAERQNKSETEKVITKLPLKLDVDRLLGLTDKPTLDEDRKFILSCYVETKELNTQNDKEYISWKLKEGLSLDDVERLYVLFDEIGYNKVAQATLATAKSKALNLLGEKS